MCCACALRVRPGVGKIFTGRHITRAFDRALRLGMRTACLTFLATATTILFALLAARESLMSSISGVLLALLGVSPAVGSLSTGGSHKAARGAASRGGKTARGGSRGSKAAQARLDPGKIAATLSNATRALLLERYSEDFVNFGYAGGG